MKHVLSIAGSDSCGGAGIQADMKTMSALGVYGMSVITAVTSQNTRDVSSVFDIPPDTVSSQLTSIFEDIKVHAVKIGMVSNAETIRIIHEKLIEYKAINIVLDPVMVSKSGCHLLKPEAVDEIKKLFVIAKVITPNIPEAEVLTGMSIKSQEDMIAAGKALMNFGAKNVLVKGGHRCNDASDVLVTSKGFTVIEGSRIDTINTHGTGCTLSSAIASLIAKGMSTEDSVKEAKSYITSAILNSFPIGSGPGPVGHFIELYKKAGVSYE